MSALLSKNSGVLTLHEHLGSPPMFGGVHASDSGHIPAYIEVILPPDKMNNKNGRNNMYLN